MEYNNQSNFGEIETKEDLTKIPPSYYTFSRILYLVILTGCLIAHNFIYYSIKGYMDFSSNTSVAKGTITDSCEYPTYTDFKYKTSYNFKDEKGNSYNNSSYGKELYNKNKEYEVEYVKNNPSRSYLIGAFTIIPSNIDMCGFMIAFIGLMLLYILTLIYTVKQVREKEKMKEKERENTKIIIKENASSLMNSLSKPPREVPFILSIQTLCGGLMIIYFTVLSIMTFGIGSTIQTGLNEARTFHGELGKSEGIITGVKKTGGKKNNKVSYYITYEFKGPDKEIHGNTYNVDYEYKHRDKVIIEYVKNNPSMSRIEGTVINKVSSAGLIIPVVFGAMFMVILYNIDFKRRLTIYRLLKIGELGKGIIMSEKKKDGMTTYLFNLTTADKKTFEDIPVSGVFNAALKAGDEYLLLYNPSNPSIAEILDTSFLSVDYNGELKQSYSFMGILSLVAPVILLIAIMNIIYLYIQFYLL